MPGPKQAVTTVKKTPKPDEFEMYNVSQDPTEMDNLAGHSAIESANATNAQYCNTIMPNGTVNNSNC